MVKRFIFTEFPSPLGVIFSLIQYVITTGEGVIFQVSVSSRSYILSYMNKNDDDIADIVSVSVSSRSYILSYELKKVVKSIKRKSFRLLSELYSLLCILKKWR